MNAVMTPLIIAGLAALVTPVLTFYINGCLSWYRNRRAYNRLQADPNIQVGNMFKGIYCRDRAEPVFGPCMMTKLQIKGIEFYNEKDVTSVFWTCHEAESLIFVREYEKKAKLTNKGLTYSRKK